MSRVKYFDKNTGNWEYADKGLGLGLDTTLTQSGKAADSQAVGNKLGNLTTLNTSAKTNLVSAINELLIGVQDADNVVMQPTEPIDHGVLWIDTDDNSGDSYDVDLSLNIGGAKVGQLARIKAIDSNGIPTEWESVGANFGSYPIVHMTNETKAILKPNTYYVWDNVATSIDITLDTPVEGDITSEYLFEFKSGDTPTNLSVPASVKWSDVMIIEKNRTYQISIMQGIGVIASV